jgi:gluconate 2-dehydrogenase gamma chain
MQRRDVLRLLATGTALQLTPLNMLALARQARALVAEQPSPRSLNPHQYATAKMMAELILPRTDTPGATDVGVADFIDLILTEWCDDAERERFLKGFADVDARSNALFSADFTASTPIQQSQILVDLGQEMGEDTSRRSRRATRSAPSPEFYPMFRRLTLTAYFTSEEGATKALNFEIIPDGYRGCDAVGIKEAAKQP